MYDIEILKKLVLCNFHLLGQKLRSVSKSSETLDIHAVCAGFLPVSLSKSKIKVI